MLERLLPFKTDTLRRPAHLPQRRWRIRATRNYVWATVGAALAALAVFVAWWQRPELVPLVAVAPAALLGWRLLLPPPLLLALDERGVALLVPRLRHDDYLWIPLDRLVRVELRQGWLVATGTDVEQQGQMDWREAAQRVGAALPPWLQLHFQSGIASQQVAAPIHLLDQVARDEIEMWIYQQGK